MTRTKFKKIPFDIELAKKIAQNEAKGRIMTEDNLHARIVCFDMKYGGSNFLAVLVGCGDYEIGIRCNLDGTCRDARKEDKFNLHIEIPTYRDYSNFVPQKWQSCLVRNSSSDKWEVGVCRGKDCYGIPVFHSLYYSDGLCYRKHFIPLSNVTAHLIGTTKSYEQLIKEFDSESTATNQEPDAEQTSIIQDA